MSVFRSWRSFEIFASSVKQKEGYIQTDEAKCFLDTLIETSKDKQITLYKEEILYRSQRGYDEIGEYDQDGTTLTGIVDLPFKPARMIPIAVKSKSGRVNPDGIPCLYLSDNLETALSEVRPWIKEKVSIAIFKVIKDLKIIDFSGIEPLSRFYFKEPEDTKIKEKEVWASVNRAFSQPVIIENQDKDYIPTQIISEWFKNSGFDGIKYKSVLASGNNYALFNLRDAIPINGVIFEVENIKYKYRQCINPVKYSIEGSVKHEK
jgi:hypothetical protein